MTLRLPSPIHLGTIHLLVNIHEPGEIKVATWIILIYSSPCSDSLFHSNIYPGFDSFTLN